MSKHVVIIGAGVVGLSTAYYCRRRGFDVTIVERHAAVRDGASFGNTGMVVPSHFLPLAEPGMVALGLRGMWNPASPFYVKPRFDAALIDWGIKFWRAASVERVQRSAALVRDLALASRRCFEEFAVLPGMNGGLVKNGLLMLCHTGRGLDEADRTAEQARALGIPANVLDAAAAAALDPGVHMTIAGAVHYPLDCHLRPAAFMAALQAELERMGAAFLWESDVEGWQVDRGRSLRAVTIGGKRQVEGDEFVLCGGSWSTTLASRVGVRIPMQAAKGYSLTLQRPRQLPRLCSVLTEAHVAVTPMGGTLRVGGTMEMSGLNGDINPARVRGIVEAFCRYFPEFRASDFAGVRPWCGLRPCSPDGLPYVGRTAKLDNLSLATGHARMGLSLGPITGKIVAEELSGEPPSHDITMLSPDRYR